MSKFAKLVGKLRKKGASADSARKIAAVVGDKKFGKEAMAQKAAASRKRHEAE